MDTNDQNAIENIYRQRVEHLEHQKQRADDRFIRRQSRLVGQLSSAMVDFDSPVLNEKQQTIIAAALNLLHTKSLDELSLRDIAKSVNMQAPALYWHFKSKTVLIDFMAEAILEKEFRTLTVRQKDETWNKWLLDQMIHLRKAMLTYPDGGRVVAGAHPYPAVTLAKIVEYSLESLHTAGVPLDTASLVITTTMRYTFGYVIEEQASPTISELKAYMENHTVNQAPYTTKLIKGIDNSRADEYFIRGSQLIIDGVKVTLPTL